MFEEFPIKTISIKEEGFPKILKEVPHPPEILYYRGESLLEENEKTLAVVGTRKYSSYGKAVVFKIVSELVKAGITIISGFAPGIDSFAHEATIENNGRTIAVLGTGLDEKFIYPRSNLKLGEKILKSKGALVSEYPPKTFGSKFSFPQRNRIIAGLSLGVLVVEAKSKSGALITAFYAKEYKRKIFAIPGSIFSSNSFGPHKLIKEGGKLVSDAEDILKEFGIEKEKEKKEYILKDEKEKLILKILSEGPKEVDEIIKITGLSSSEVLAKLTILESEEMIKNLGGGRYTIL
jgi:DNA processing protein